MIVLISLGIQVSVISIKLSSTLPEVILVEFMP